MHNTIMRRQRPPEESEKYFWSNVRKTRSCWVWLGPRMRHWSGDPKKVGHGRLWLGDRWETAHRYSYLLTHGKITEGLVIHHTCGNMGCVNPAHLEALSADAHSKTMSSPHGKNSRKTHCLRGHLLSEENVYIERKREGGIARKCRECARARTKNRAGAFASAERKKNPNREELLQLVRTHTWTEIGLMYGVTDSAVRKWAKKYNIIG